jgi:protein-tyrosine phosphatase
MLDIVEIIPGLWQGADPGTELPPHIRVVVDLRDDLPPQLYHNYLRGLLWMPIMDGCPPPSMHWLNSIVDFSIGNLGYEVMVHCAVGVSRSAFICTAILMKHLDLSVENALSFLRAKHPAINPAPCYHAALYQYQTYLADRYPTPDSDDEDEEQEGAEA